MCGGSCLIHRHESPCPCDIIAIVWRADQGERLGVRVRMVT